MRGSLLVALASLTLWSQVPAPRPPLPIPGLAKSIQRPDLLLHFKDYGQGEPVLILTGGPGFSGESMEPVAQMLAKRGRAILLDQRGTGESQPKVDEAITLDGTLADIEALRKELGLNTWTVLGCSWGGMLALDYAAKFPGSLKAMILLDSGGTSWASFGRVFWDNITCRMTQEEHAVRRYWSQKEVNRMEPLRAPVEFMRTILPAYFYDRTKALPFIAGLKVGKEHFNPASERLDKEFDQGESARIEALRKITIPTLIIHGRQDPMPESVAMTNQALLKGSHLVWLDRCGHFAWLEQPEALEKALLAFLFP